MQHFDHDISAYELTKMHTLGDVVTYFQKEVRVTSPIEDMSQLRLPPNLNIQLEPVRYDQKRDTLFGGINAFPGMDGHVTSIKYRRKYKTILNSDPKPGYASYYFEDWRP